MLIKINCAKTMNRVKATGVQLGFLEDYMKTHPKIAAGYVGRCYERRLELEQRWKQLASTLNSLGGAKKSVSKWRQTWRDLRSNSKRKILNNRMELQSDSMELQSDSIDIKPLIVLPISNDNEGGDKWRRREERNGGESTDSDGSCNDLEDEGRIQSRENFDIRLLKIEEEKIMLKKKNLELKKERNRIEESRNATLNSVSDVLEKILNSLNK